MHPFKWQELKEWLNNNLKRFTIFYKFLHGVGGERGLLDQIFPDATTATIYMTTNLSWKKTPGTKSQLYIHTMPGARSDHRPPKTSAACFLSSIHLSFFTVSRVGETRRRGEECSVLSQSFACTSAPKTTREREKKKCKKAAGMEEEWKMRGVGGQWTKSAELDYISFGLYGSVPYKSLPSLKGLQGRWIKPNSEGITKGGKA